MEAAPYDNVEFGPVTRKTGTWPGSQQQQTSSSSLGTTQHHHHHQQQQQQHTSRTLQHGKVGVGVGVGGGSRLAPLEESQAEVPESRDQRFQAVVTQHAASSSFSSSSSSSQAHRAGFPTTTTAATTTSSFSSSSTRTGANSGLLNMSAPTTPSTATATTAASSGASGTSKTTSSTVSNNKAADSSKANASAPAYVLTQVGSGGTKDTTGLRSSDDDVAFKRHDLDPPSRAALEAAYTNHKQFYRLNSRVLDEGVMLKQDVMDIYRKGGESFSYEQLLQGMLEEGEMLLLGGCWLHYVHMEFKDEAGEKIVRQPYGKGRLCLTSNRVLLLSADVYTDASLEPYGQVKTDRGYKLEVSKRSCIIFHNLPLSCFYSADLEVNIGTSAQTKITPKKAPCCGLCSCFGMECCGRSWHAEPPMTRSFNERVVRMGVALPPWGRHAILVMHLDPGQSLTTARDFVVQLHQHSPNMH